jgi:hypothetical protein
MLARRAIHLLSGLLVVWSVTLCGCAKPPAQPIVEQPIVTQASPAVSSPPAEMPKLPPPRLEEVEQAVRRIFKSAVVIDASRTPGFFIGDFNGDSSQDLAVIVKPAQGKLSELNQEFPAWLAREPLKEVLLPKSKVMVPSRPINAASGQAVRFEQNDVLLAIIHGTGPKGWRDPEATQTHLLRDVVGTNMKALAFKNAVQAYKGIKPFPDLYGDLIQQMLIGQSGFIHFNGGVYAWYDPKNYRSAITTMPGHPGMSAMSSNPKPNRPNPAGTRR